MTRGWLAGGLALVLAGLGALAISGRPGDVPGPRPVADRPALALVTSLPLIFSEGFALDDGGSAVLTRLEQRYRVQPIGVTDAASLGRHRLLLMAHPRAQPAGALVDLDRWVRDGGHLLLLADPRLEWPSERPLGDLLRPPPMFADTGLLAHWGLRLDPPLPGGDDSAGRLSGGGAGCRIAEHGWIASCRIGKGKATVVADADFLNSDQPEAPGLDRLMIELGRLEAR